MNIESLIHIVLSLSKDEPRETVFEKVNNPTLKGEVSLRGYAYENLTRDYCESDLCSTIFE